MSSYFKLYYVYMCLINHLAIYNDMHRRGGGGCVHDEELLFLWPVHEQQELHGFVHPTWHWRQWVLLLLETNMQMYPSMSLEKNNASRDRVDT
jgi:hypothetical protein